MSPVAPKGICRVFGLAATLRIKPHHALAAASSRFANTAPSADVSGTARAKTSGVLQSQ